MTMSTQKIHENILQTIGQTPIIRLNRIGKELEHEMLIKVEAMNPGASVKDRLALQIIEDAKAEGKLKKGGVIIETTSGNTGMGLAMIAAVEGYKCIFTMPDKVSEEKINALKAFGAEVRICPTSVEPEDPRSYYSVAKKLAEEIPGAFYSNQYFNPSNPKAHYRYTGPEIYDQLGDQLDVLVAGIGTGGTLCGSAKFLREKLPDLQTVGIDPVGSVYYEYFNTGVMPKIVTTYKVEGVGEDFMPSTIDFDLIDDVVQVTDQEAFDMTRRLAQEEGVFVGGSCGMALCGAIKKAKNIEGKKTILTILPDSGSRYISKIFNDAWMKQEGFLPEDQSPSGSTALEEQIRF